jgi:hypothetical protein
MTYHYLSLFCLEVSTKIDLVTQNCCDFLLLSMCLFFYFLVLHLLTHFSEYYIEHSYTFIHA